MRTFKFRNDIKLNYILNLFDSDFTKRKKQYCNPTVIHQISSLKSKSKCLYYFPQAWKTFDGHHFLDHQICNVVPHLLGLIVHIF